MAAYQTHLRKIRDNEVLYGGSKPTPKPYTTDRDILDAQHKFLRDETSETTAPLVKEYYESLIKDCVLVDLSRYNEKQVAMRWRTIEEVKAGKGDKICANIACGRGDGLKEMEVAFGYVEDGKRNTVLVKCVLCEKCERKLGKARGTKKKKRRRSHGRHSRSRGHAKEDEKNEEEKESERKRRRHCSRDRERRPEDPDSDHDDSDKQDKKSRQVN